MSKTRMISTNFWKDSYIVNLDPSEKLLFLYFLTNPRTTIAGVYELNLREVAFDTGFDIEMVKKITERFMRDSKVFVAEGWVVVRNWNKWQSMNPSVRKGIDRDLQQLPGWLSRYVLTDDEGNRTSIDWDSLYTASDSLGTESDILNLTKPNGTNLTKPNGTNAADAAAGERLVLTKRERTIELDGMFTYWLAHLGYAIEAKVKQNREYAGKLLDQYEKPAIAAAIQAAARASEDRYAPRVANFIDLYRKWDELKLWDKRAVTGSTSKQGVVI